jgi:hypothetical protein
LIKTLTAFDIVNDSHILLVKRMIRAHCTLDFGPKLVHCQEKMGGEAFTEAMLSAGWEQFGAIGLALADLIQFSMRADPRLSVDDVYGGAVNAGPSPKKRGGFRKKLARELERLIRQIKAVWAKA